MSGSTALLVASATIIVGSIAARYAYWGFRRYQALRILIEIEFVISELDLAEYLSQSEAEIWKRRPLRALLAARDLEPHARWLRGDEACIFRTICTRLVRIDGFTLEFMTAHRSKGQEADFVIVVNVTNAVKGFPSGISDDPMIRMVLFAREAFLFTEERRLFYVALTRARCRELGASDRSWHAALGVAERGVPTPAASRRHDPTQNAKGSQRMVLTCSP